MTIATLGAIGEVMFVGVMVMEVGTAEAGAFVSGGGVCCLVASSE